MNLYSYALILSAAFMASLYHCMGMCGAIVLYINMNQSLSKFAQILSNVIYFFGRMLGYITIGIIFYIIGKSFVFSHTANAITLIVLGILLFVLSFFTTFYPKALSKLLPNSDYVWYKRIFSALLDKRGMLRNFVIGILNGFLPCHLVYMFALKASASDNIIHAICTMIAFACGTFLPLFLFGILSIGAINSKYRHIAMKISFVIMAYFSFMSIYNGILALRNTADSTHMHHHMSHTHH